MNTQTIPRTVIESAFCAARWPVERAASVLGGDDTKRWSPLLAFDALQATVEESLGSLLRDDGLIEAGHALRRRADDLRASLQTEAAAAALAERARDEFEATRTQATQRRTAAQQKAQRERARVDKAEVDRTRAADLAAQRREAKAHTAAAKREEAVKRRARSGKAEELAAASTAVQKEKAALAAKRQAARTDAELRQTRARRRAASTN